MAPNTAPVSSKEPKEAHRRMLQRTPPFVASIPLENPEKGGMTTGELPEGRAVEVAAGADPAAPTADSATPLLLLLLLLLLLQALPWAPTKPSSKQVTPPGAIINSRRALSTLAIVDECPQVSPSQLQRRDQRVREG